MITYEMHTTLVEEEACLTWTFHNSNAFKLLQNLKSPEFTVASIRKRCFFIYRRSTRGASYDVYLEHCDEFVNSAISAYTIISGKKEQLVASNEWGGKSYAMNMYRYNVFDDTRGAGNDRTICLEIKYLKNIEMEKSYPQEMPPSTYDKFFKNEELCDVVFMFNTEQIKAHAVVLAAASPYFLAMFNNKDTVENISRTVDLSKDDDITFENFKGFLEFIYGCKSIDELSSIVYDLLILADKYNVDHLHEACQHYMSNNISEENIVKILLLSDKYNCKSLKMKAIQFARANIAIIKNSDEFDTLCKVADVMRLLM